MQKLYLEEICYSSDEVCRLTAIYRKSAKSFICVKIKIKIKKSVKIANKLNKQGQNLSTAPLESLTKLKYLPRTTCYVFNMINISFYILFLTSCILIEKISNVSVSTKLIQIQGSSVIIKLANSLAQLSLVIKNRFYFLTKLV